LEIEMALAKWLYDKVLMCDSILNNSTNNKFINNKSKFDGKFF